MFHYPTKKYHHCIGHRSILVPSSRLSAIMAPQAARCMWCHMTSLKPWGLPFPRKMSDWNRFGTPNLSNKIEQNSTFANTSQHMWINRANLQFGKTWHGGCFWRFPTAQPWHILAVSSKTNRRAAKDVAHWKSLLNLRVLTHQIIRNVLNQPLSCETNKAMRHQSFRRISRVDPKFRTHCLDCFPKLSGFFHYLTNRR